MSAKSASADGVELSPEELARLAEEMARLVVEHVVHPEATPYSGASREAIDALLLEEPPVEPLGPDALVAAVRDGLFPHSRDYRHRLHFGHQRPAPLAAAAIADLAVSALNPGSQTYEASPYAAALEKRVLRWMAELAGFPSESAAAFTNGGSESNLTALLCARDAAARANDGRAPLVFTSAEAHYSIVRAAHVLGLGEEAVVRVPTGAKMALDPEALRREMAAAEASGKRPIAVVAVSGSTGCGAFDDLRAVGGVARAHGAWLHVDGAHGASLLLSPSLRDRLAGLDEADSVAWNAHKMLWVAPPCGILLVRRRRDLRLALAPGLGRASYVVPDARILEELDRDVEDHLHWTLATTRLCMGLKIYAALVVYGLSGLRRRIERTVELTRALHRLVEESPDFEALGAPEVNILCFRHTGGDDAHNRRLRDRLARAGATYLTGTELAGRYWLRATLMSENITEDSLVELLDVVRAAAVAKTVD